MLHHPLSWIWQLCTSGVIATPPESSAGEVLEKSLNTGLNMLHGVNTDSPFIVPPELGQLHDFQTYRTSESRPSFSLLSLSASSSALTLMRKPAKCSSSSSSIDRCHHLLPAVSRNTFYEVDAPFHSHLCRQPLRGTTSPPPGEALLLPPADNCLIPGLADPNTAVRCEPFPGSEPPCYLPAYATVRAVPPAGPSGSSDWVGFQDIYVSASETFDLCNARNPGGGRVTTLWNAESFMQVLGVRRSVVFRWKPGLRIAAASYSGPVAARYRLQFWCAVHDRTMCAVPEGLIYLRVIV